jgi:hypothetical protein
MSSILSTIARELEEALAPLTTGFHNNASIRVRDVIDNDRYILEVFAPEHCRIFVPKKYEGMTVKFTAVDDTLISINREIKLNNKHGLFA